MTLFEEKGDFINPTKGERSGGKKKFRIWCAYDMGKANRGTLMHFFLKGDLLRRKGKQSTANLLCGSRTQKEKSEKKKKEKMGCDALGKGLEKGSSLKRKKDSNSSLQTVVSFGTEGGEKGTLSLLSRFRGVRPKKKEGKIIIRKKGVLKPPRRKERECPNFTFFPESTTRGRGGPGISSSSEKRSVSYGREGSDLSVLVQKKRAKQGMIPTGGEDKDKALAIWGGFFF